MNGVFTIGAYACAVALLCKMFHAIWRRNSEAYLRSKAEKEDAEEPKHAQVVNFYNVDKGECKFDYSTNSGIVSIGEGDAQFLIKFSKRSDSSIYVYSDGTNLLGVARIKSAKTGQALKYEDYDSSSRCYAIDRGEHFIAKNRKGYCMQARIVNILDDGRGAEHDEVQFTYQINRSGGSEFLAI